MDFAELKKNMIRGFNTYYNNSVLTHVLMPQGIAISLGFKFYNTGQVLREALIGRFGKNDEIIHPGSRSFDGTYTELKLFCSDHEIIVQSTVIEEQQYILVTPLKICSRPPALLISATILWNKPGYTQLERGRLFAVTPDRMVEVLSDGKAVRQLNTGLSNPYIAVELSQPTAVSTGKRISAAELKMLMEKQRTGT